MIVLVVTNERRVNDDDDDEVICTNFEAPRHVQTRLAATAAVKVVEGIIYDCYDIVVVITKRSLMDTTRQRGTLCQISLRGRRC